MKPLLPISAYLLAGVVIGCSSGNKAAPIDSGAAAATGGTSDGGTTSPEASGGNGGTTNSSVIDGGPSGGLVISGPVDSEVQGEGRTVFLLWEVVSGSPDYSYKFGQGRVTNGRFSITLPGDPPGEAINSFGVGIALVVVLPEGKTLADGRLSRSDFSAEDIAGVSSRSSVVWRAPTLSVPDEPPADFWPLAFPAGYTCGACASKPDGGSFERYVPAACDQVRITTYDVDQMCDWT